jgi:hypothetical protein
MFRAACLIAALLAAPAAQAATVKFNNLAAFDAALGSPSSVAETFTGNTLTGTIIAGISGAHNFNNNRLEQIAGTAVGIQSTTLTFSTAMTAFAASIGNLSGLELVNVYLDGVLATTISGGATFFGLTSTRAFTTITFADATWPVRNTQFNIDNLRVSAVPLPAAAGLLLAGMGLLAGAARRRNG